MSALRGRDVVCVGFADWDAELWTNQHHLMARLARRQPRPVRRVARPAAPAAHRRARPARGSPAACAAGLRRARASRRPARAVAARRAAARRPRARALNARPAAARRWAAPRGRLGLAAPAAVELRPAGRAGCVDTLAPSARDLPLRRRHRRPARASTAERSGRPRSASRRAPISCWPPRRRSPSACAHWPTHVLYAPNVADTALFARALDDRRRSTPRWPRCRDPRIVFTGAVVGHEARPRAAGRARARAAGMDARPRRPGRPRATRAPTSRRCRRCRTSTCSGRAATRSCRRCCAAPTAALVPYADQRR